MTLAQCGMVGKEKLEDVVPTFVAENLARAGVTKLHSWQRTCVAYAESQGVMSGDQNFLFTAPTSAGKTLVAEVIMLKSLVERHKAALFVVPYRCLVDERTEWLRRVWAGGDINVIALRGGAKSELGRHESLASGRNGCPCCVVATLESANMLLNRLLKNGREDELGVVVVDELHMIGDASRGWVLETMLMKIRSIDVPIVGMTATLSPTSLTTLSKWLKAKHFESGVRPVELVSRIVHRVCDSVGDVETHVSDASGKVLRKLPRTSLADDPMSDAVVTLCAEVAPPCVAPPAATPTVYPAANLRAAAEDAEAADADATLVPGSVLIFCSTKKWCNSCTNHIADARRTHDEPSLELHKKRQSLCERLDRAGMGERELNNVMHGVGCHHADIPQAQRMEIERAFRGREGVLPIIVCTSTLATGVNLPAQRVIVRGCLNGKRDPIASAAFRQMAGRAGRTGQVARGDAFLIVNKTTAFVEAQCILSNPVADVQSSLQFEHRSSSSSVSEQFTEQTWLLGKAAIEAIAVGLADTPAALETYFSKSLSRSSGAADDLQQEQKPALWLKLLREHKFIAPIEVAAVPIETPESGALLQLTPLGNAIFYSGVHPRNGLTIHRDLSRISHRLILTCSLPFLLLFSDVAYAHVAYDHATAQDINSRWAKGSSSKAKALRTTAHAFGIRSEQIHGWATKTPKFGTEDAIEYSRFVTSLMLHDLLIKRDKSDTVAKTFKVPLGKLLRIKHDAIRHGASVQVFAHHLNWKQLEAALTAFVTELKMMEVCSGRNHC